MWSTSQSRWRFNAERVGVRRGTLISVRTGRGWPGGVMVVGVVVVVEKVAEK